jgi:fructan beta-fructosidase
MARKVATALAAGILLTALIHSSAESRSADYRQRYRPQFHFSPERNWMNDPNGLVHYRGEYHLFYQYNPFGNDWGHMSWGHAASPDMVHWRQLPVAIPEQNGVMIFSGSAVVDWHDSSGLCRGSESCLIAIYTGYTGTEQNQNLAYSNDGGLTWTKYASNPVIDLHLKDFRDPKVFWYQPQKKWIMVVSLAAEHRVRLYSSQDLKQWTALSEFGPAGARNPPTWECPDLFQLPVSNEPGVSRWVLTVGVGDHAAGGGSGVQYFIGKFDGRRFTNDNPATKTLWVDYGMDFYAAQTWSDIPSSDGRRIILGWMDDWRYAANIPTEPWRGQMSVPRVVTLNRFPAGIRIVQAPIAELHQLRGEQFRMGAQTLRGNSRVLEAHGIRAFEIQAEFQIGSAQEFGVRLRKSPGNETLVGYDSNSHQMFVDRKRSDNVAFSKDFPVRNAVPLVPESGIIRFHIFVDRCSVEVFGGGGRRVITDLVFPGAGSDGLELYSKGGSVKLRSLELWKLKSAWK